jgi:hypothetical protein
MKLYAGEVSPETSVNVDKTILHHNPEDGNIHIQCRENVKPHTAFIFCRTFV